MDELLVRARDGLLAAAGSGWVHQFGLVVLAIAVAWVPARLIERRWLTPAADERALTRILRCLAGAAVWPILGIGIAAIVLEIARLRVPGFFGTGEEVRSVLKFFLVFRILDALPSALDPARRRRRGLRRTLLTGLLLVIVLDQLDWLDPVIGWLQRPLFTAGDTVVSSMSILLALLALVVMAWLAGVLKGALGGRILPRLGIDITLAEALATVARYIVVVVGIFWALDLLGFDLSSVGFALGALGVGIGLGLQGIVNNFVSGLILMFEGSIKRGDVLTVAGTDARVKRIGLRASVIRTREGEDLIVPNSMFTDNTITNYSFGDELKLVQVRVGVSYSADPNTVEKILLEIASQDEQVIDDPAPNVRFREFGDSSLNFDLRVWIRDPWGVPATNSRLLFAAWYALEEAGIEIPFPQRDLHVRSGELQVRLRKDEAEG